MSTESIIIKTIVIAVLFMLIMATPKAHAARMGTMAYVANTEGTSHACF